MCDWRLTAWLPYPPCEALRLFDTVGHTAAAGLLSSRPIEEVPAMRTERFSYLCAVVFAALWSEPVGADPQVATRVATDESLTRAIVLEGVVLGPDGGPAEGAVVTSSAGGSAICDFAGYFHIETQVAVSADRVQVFAE